MKAKIATIIEELNLERPIGNAGNYCCTVWIHWGDLEKYTDFNVEDWRNVSHKLFGPIASEYAEAAANRLQIALEAGGFSCLRIDQSDE